MKLKKKYKQGFTLIEMLVIIGIIGIIAASMMTSVSHLKASAKRARAQTAVSDTYTALNLYLQKERQWHGSMINALEMDEFVCKELVKKSLMDLSISENTANSTSVDRFGFLDEWGRDALARNPNITTSQQLGFDGIKIEDHRIQFRLDLNYDGYVDQSEDSPNGMRIRANLVVWSRGPDGQDDFASKNPKASNRYPYDDLISWNQAQVSSDQ